MAKADVPIDRIEVRRIGIVADTHSGKPDGSDLAQAVFDALRGVDLVLHLGDMGVVGSLDRFARVAPVLATKGAHSVGSDPRIAPRTRVIETGRFAIGALFELPKLAPGIQINAAGELVLPPDPIAPLLDTLFGRRMDVVAFAATHAPCVVERDGVLFVNPGSPNLPAKPPGTVAILELGKRTPEAEIRRVRPE